MDFAKRKEMFKGLKRLIENIFWSVIEELHKVYKHREMLKNRRSIKGSIASRKEDIIDMTDEEFRIAIAKGIEAIERNPYQDSFKAIFPPISDKRMVNAFLKTIDFGGV